jgi:acylphosphatase
MKKRYHVFVEGRVQGVGFRGFCMIRAQRYNLTGSVRNLPNGTMVEIFVQGEDTDIDRFLEDVEKGDRFIRVDNITTKPTALVEGEKRFSYGAGW